MDVSGRRESMDRERKLFRSTIVLMLGLILPRAVALITIKFISEGVVKGDYGNYNVMTNIVLNLFIPIVTLQIGEGIFRFLIDSDEKKSNYYISSALSYLVVAIIMTIVAFFLFTFDGFEGQLKYIIIIYAVVELINIYIRPIARGLGHNKVYSISGIITAIINLITCYLFVIVWELGVVGLLYSVILSDIVGLIYMIWKVKLHNFFGIAFVRKEAFLKLLGYSIPLIPNLIAWYILTLSDQLIIKWFINEDAVGIYSMAAKIPSIITMIYHGFNMAWQESAARSLNDQDVNKYYSKMLFNLTRVLTAGTIGLIAFTPVVFALMITGAEYASAYSYIGLMILTAFLNCISTYYGSLYIASKDTKGISISSVVAAVVNIIIHLALIRFIGLYAAVISTVVAYIVLVLYRVIDIQKNYFKLHYYKRLIIICSVGLVISLILFALGENSKIIMYGNMIYSVVFALFLCGDIGLNIIKTLIRKLRKSV